MSSVITEKNGSASFANPGGSGNNHYNQNDHIRKSDDAQILLEVSKLKESNDFFSSVDKLVENYRHSSIRLKPPNSYVLTFGNLDDTVFWDSPEMLETWEELYLPETVRMKVVGTIDEHTYMAFLGQLIVLVGEDSCVYIYENEELHKAALNLQDLLTKGATLPGIEVYEYGAAIKQLTTEEIQEFMKDPDIQKIEEETRALIKSNSVELRKMLQYLAEP